MTDVAGPRSRYVRNRTVERSRAMGPRLRNEINDSGASNLVSQTRAGVRAPKYCDSSDLAEDDNELLVVPTNDDHKWIEKCQRWL
jgi:hypothetical protein